MKSIIIIWLQIFIFNFKAVKIGKQSQLWSDSFLKFVSTSWYVHVFTTEVAYLIVVTGFSFTIDDLGWYLTSCIIRNLSSLSRNKLCFTVVFHPHCNRDTKLDLPTLLTERIFSRSLVPLFSMWICFLVSDFFRLFFLEVLIHFKLK